MQCALLTGAGPRSDRGKVLMSSGMSIAYGREVSAVGMPRDMSKTRSAFLISPVPKHPCKGLLMVLQACACSNIRGCPRLLEIIWRRWV
jgi:hypothetical protein